MRRRCPHRFYRFAFGAFHHTQRQKHYRGSNKRNNHKQQDCATARATLAFFIFHRTDPLGCLDNSGAGALDPPDGQHYILAPVFADRQSSAATIER
jgi:hypothetical protein